jgi:catechol 2,3-dioxygenase-like lactoylglutathione lyase family enzyme
MHKFLLSFTLCFPLLAQVAPPNSIGVSMGHYHIVTSDAEAQKRLWIGALGGKLVKSGALEYAMFPGVLIGFRKGESSGGTEGSIVDHIAFAVRSAASVREKLSAAGARIIKESADKRQFFAFFPGDVKVEFIEERTLDVPIKHHHLHFASNHSSEMRAWYARMFGAVPGMRDRFLAADLPGVNLSWTDTEKPTSPTKGRSLDHVSFEVKDIRSFCARLEAEGVKLDTSPTPRPDLGLTLAFLTDPWGTRIELTEGLASF